jgi:predicted Zn finger-like uncharacterized protein
MIIQCPKCGFKIEINEKKYEPNSKHKFGCPRCGNSFEVDIPEIIEVQPSKEETPEITNNNEAIYTTSQQEENSRAAIQPEEPNNANLIDSEDEEKKQSSWIKPVLLISIALCVGGLIAYFAWYKPYLRDKNAPRTYTIANRTNIRTSKDAGGDYNKICSLPFGSELITYNNDGEWAEVKDAKGEKGFMSAAYLVNKADFLLLNSIFGDSESRENISTIKCRRALLNYYKQNKLIGKISAENLQIVNPQIIPNEQNQWQIFCRAKGVSPNNVYFPRVINPDSKYSNFAVIIKNISTGERKTLLFYFDDDETPHFGGEYSAPSDGYIINVISSYGNEIYVNYSV